MHAKPFRFMSAFNALYTLSSGVVGQAKRAAPANSPKENMIASSLTKMHAKPFRFISAFNALYTLERRCWAS